MAPSFVSDAVGKPTLEHMKQIATTIQSLNPARATRFFVAALFALSASPLHAHPGHPIGDQGVSHVISSPYHLSILAALGLALWLGAWFVQRQGARRLLQAGGIAALLVAFVLLGLRP